MWNWLKKVNEKVIDINLKIFSSFPCPIKNTTTLCLFNKARFVNKSISQIYSKYGFVVYGVFNTFRYLFTSYFHLLYLLCELGCKQALLLDLLFTVKKSYMTAWYNIDSLSDGSNNMKLWEIESKASLLDLIYTKAYLNV